MAVSLSSSRARDTGCTSRGRSCRLGTWTTWDGRGTPPGESVRPEAKKERADASDWALVIPCYLMVVVLLAYLVYAGMSVYLAPPFDALGLITGECGIEELVALRADS